MWAVGDDRTEMETWRSSWIRNAWAQSGVRALLLRVDAWVTESSLSALGAALVGWVEASAIARWARAAPHGQVSISLSESGLLPADLLGAVERSKTRQLVQRLLPRGEVLVWGVVATLGLGFWSVSLFSIPELLLVLAAVVLGIEAMTDRTVSLTPAAIGGLLAMTGLLVWTAASILATNAPIRPLVTRMGRWLAFLVVLLAVDTERDVDRLLSVAAAAAVLLSLLTLAATVVELPMEPRTIPPRTFGPVTMPVGRVLPVPMAFGIFGMILLFPLPYLVLRGWREHSWGSLAGAGVIVLAVVIGQSRSTYLAVAVAATVLAIAGGVWAVAEGPPRWRRAIGVSGLVGTLIAIPSSVIGARILIAAERINYVRRLEQARLGLVALADRPVFGTGPEQFQSVAGADNVLHTAWLGLGAEIGLVALLLVGMAAYLATRQVVRTAIYERSGLAVVVLAGMAAVAVEASLQGSFGRPTWIVLAIALSAPWR
jgi:hypothetical protein